MCMRISIPEISRINNMLEHIVSGPGLWLGKISEISVN